MDNKVPFYHPRQKHQSEKGVDDLYPFGSLAFSKNDVKSTYKGVMTPLALFAPFHHEDTPPSDVLELDRPVTPINEEIKAPPPTFVKLGKLVRRRITTRTDTEHLSNEDQQALAAVIMGEVTAIWPDLRQQVSDPFLTVEQNKELQRRITVHIVTVCERLFYHYIEKAQVLNKRGVFSGPANTSRLKAQLALDANKFLNILTIRRYIVGDMRIRSKEAMTPYLFDTSPMKRAPAVDHQQGLPALSFMQFVEASRPKSSGRRQKYTSAEEGIRQLHANMPTLDTGKLMDIIAEMPQARPPSQLSDEASLLSVSMAEVSCTSPTNQAKHQQLKRRESEELSREKVILKRCASATRLGPKDTLMEELAGVADGRASALSLVDPALLHTERHYDQDPSRRPPEEESLSITGDLANLMAHNKKQDLAMAVQATDEEDLPPLIQALTRSARHDGKGEILKKQLLELEERERRRVEEESISIQEPLHPQPATVAAKLPNKMVVKASDIRVSERVCLSSITLSKFTTVYNDLIDEIEPDTVKHLDSNLFLGDEIKEVYQEIMKTVPSDHLGLEQDVLVEPTATSVNLTAAMASSSLSKPPRERIINQELHHSIQPPWGEMELKDWAKTPLAPPTDLHGRTLIDSMVPHGNIDPLAAITGKTQKEEPPANQQDFMARSYASWLMWWKQTINSDDYMKYLSTQETDYMGVVFHFYNSDDEDTDDEDDEKTSRANKLAAKQALLEEREQKLNAMRQQKAEYKDGFWNANAVLLGGLGKDPVLEGDMTDLPKTPSVTETAPTLKTAHSKTRVTQKKSTRSLHVVTEVDIGDKSARTKETRSQTVPTPFTALSYVVLGSRSGASVKSEAVSKQTGEVKPQDRLERVWAALHMPDNFKLDMAIKYSSDDHHEMLSEAIECWEEATDLIIKREHLIAKLEQFERLASDPNRFFEKGHRGSSVARLEEAKTRSTYYKKIDQLDVAIKKVLEDIRDNFGDTVTFQGRPYMDKLKWDRVEMLYWLQEERKQQALESEAHGQQMALSRLQLDPIVPTPSPTKVA